MPARLRGCCARSIIVGVAACAFRRNAWMWPSAPVLVPVVEPSTLMLNAALDTSVPRTPRSVWVCEPMTRAVGRDGVEVGATGLSHAAIPMTQTEASAILFMVNLLGAAATCGWRG